MPFVEPMELDHPTLLLVLQQFVAFEHAYANAQQEEMHGMPGGHDPSSSYHGDPSGGYQFGEAVEGYDVPQAQYAQQAFSQPHSQPYDQQSYTQQYDQQQYDQPFHDGQLFAQQSYAEPPPSSQEAQGP